MFEQTNRGCFPLRELEFNEENLRVHEWNKLSKEDDTTAGISVYRGTDDRMKCMECKKLVTDEPIMCIQCIRGRKHTTRGPAPPNCQRSRCQGHDRKMDQGPGTD